VKKPALTAMMVILICLAPSYGLPRDSLQWQELVTTHTIIHYLSDHDLKQFDTFIRFGRHDRSIDWKVDAIFKRAQQILDMKKRFPRVHIHLYPDSNALKRACEALYGGDCRFRAWYRFANNTVYLNIQDVHAGILAHELAHAIVDHFLGFRPPSRTAEILARYVDTHLGRGPVQ
jgi:hypothetical protein